MFVGAAETIGGVLFGRLSDKIGATPVMLFGCGATHALAFVLVYINFIASMELAVFTCLSYLVCHSGADSVCGCAQRAGAAARESLRRNRCGRLTSPAFCACGSASPFAHVAVTAFKDK